MMSSRAAEDVLQREGNTKKNTIGKKMKVSKSMSSILAIVLPKQLWASNNRRREEEETPKKNDAGKNSGREKRKEIENEAKRWSASRPGEVRDKNNGAMMWITMMSVITDVTTCLQAWRKTPVKLGKTR